jgi:hypothetical protein
MTSQWRLLVSGEKTWSSTPLGRFSKAWDKSMGYKINRIPGGEQYGFGPRPEDRDKWIKGIGIRTILDVGAHAGEGAEQFAGLFPEAMIYLRTPSRLLPPIAGQIADRANHMAFNVALGDRSGPFAEHRRSALERIL